MIEYEIEGHFEILERIHHAYSYPNTINSNKTDLVLFKRGLTFLFSRCRLVPEGSDEGADEAECHIDPGCER